MRTRDKTTIWFLVLLTCATAGCSSSPQRGGPSELSFAPAGTIETPANLVWLTASANQFAKRPGFPETFNASLKAAASSHGGNGAPVNGSEYMLAHGYNNRAGETCPNGYIIAPGGNDDLAWAEYNLGAFNSKRPVKVKVNVTGVIAPGGNDDLPLIYWVGISDHTCGQWAMSGPYTSSVDIAVNSDQWYHRCVDSTNEMQVLILTDATGIEHTDVNPEGITAVEITTLSVTANNHYKRTAPILPYNLTLSYDPTQYSVELSWTHLVDTSSSSNEAAVYTVTRLLVGESTPVVIGSTTAPDTAFTDPVDDSASVPELVPGETYQYYIKADNGIATTSVLVGEVTI
jgi:hypothetical protein